MTKQRNCFTVLDMQQHKISKPLIKKISSKAGGDNIKMTLGDIAIWFGSDIAWKCIPVFSVAAKRDVLRAMLPSLKRMTVKTKHSYIPEWIALIEEYISGKRVITKKVLAITDRYFDENKKLGDKESHMAFLSLYALFSIVGIYIKGSFSPLPDKAGSVEKEKLQQIDDICSVFKPIIAK